MRDIREGMWERVKNRVWQESLFDSLVGDYKYDYNIRLMEEYKKIFGLKYDSGMGEID